MGKEFNQADKAKHAKRAVGKKLSAMPEHVGKLRKRGMISDKQHERMMNHKPKRVGTQTGHW